jgi:superfamily II DNA or RNA helicase
VVPALNAVLDAIARAVLGSADGFDEHEATLGSVTLRPHQLDALHRIRASIERVSGALLADEPGLGKTFVALALAREFPHTIVVAPAALRRMWHDAAATAGVDAPFISLEALSRRDVRIAAQGGLMIVDEAHHVCNPATARYARLARLISNRRVLLLSATPVRNRRAELAALLALFTGPRAHTLDDAERSRCIVRRGGDASLLPAIDGPHWHRVRALPRLGEMIAALPPPLPALDGRRATALLSITLARCWASSLAALDAALRRRLQRGAALETLLDAGRLPTRDELRAWVIGDDAVQLAFPLLVVHETSDATRLRAVLDTHLDAVRALRARIQPRVNRDIGARTTLLLDLRRAYEGAKMVAFTAHAATAEALYRALRRERGVALLTARGARTAGGSRPRSDVIDALAGSAVARTHDDISLVITTDLLSEGVNLQGASVIVHLDVPWTPAGLDQRVGRAARMGSRHACVHVHGFAPPAAAERLLTLERRLARKHAEQAEASRAPRETEALRAIVETWRQPGSGSGPGPLVASVCALRTGFIAVVESRTVPALVCGALRGNLRWKISDAPGDLCEIASAVSARAAEPDAAFESSARAALERWLAGRRARESAGAASMPSRARRLLLARIDAAVHRADAHSRAALANRVARVRALIDSAVSADAERTLDELTRSGAGGLESWLTVCESRLADGTSRIRQRDTEPPAVRALLLLRRPA